MSHAFLALLLLAPQDAKRAASPTALLDGRLRIVKRIRTLKLLLAGANLLLGGAIVLFAALFLFARPRTDPGAGLPAVPPTCGVPVSGTGELPALPNPMTDRRLDVRDSRLAVLLLGTLPNEARPGLAAAFLRSAAGKDEFVAFVGEKVGPWTLEAVHRDRAVFASADGRREVRLEDPRR